MKAPRWTAVSQSAFDREREALDFLRDNLPDHEPWRAWSNFEFIDDEERVNEVDALVLTPLGLILCVHRYGAGLELPPGGPSGTSSVRQRPQLRQQSWRGNAAGQPG